jgi:tyrosyl-tRNA synthetase
MTLKMTLAESIVANFHSLEAAVEARNEFNRVVRQKQMPTDIERVALPEEVRGVDGIKIDKLLAKIGLSDSVTDAARKRKAGAVVIDEQRLGPNEVVRSLPPGEHTINVGKRWKRVVVPNSGSA